MIATPILMMMAGALIGLGTALIAVEYFIHMPRRPLAWRLQYLERVRDQLAAGEDSVTDEPRRSSPSASVTTALIVGLRILNRVLGSMVMFSKADQEKLQTLLRHAGIRSPEALGLLFTAKAALVLLGGSGVFAAQVMLPPDTVDPMLFWVFAIPSVVVLGSIPERVVTHLAERRRDAINESLPDALDMMIICTNAGYGLDVTIARVARDLRSFAKEMAEEMSITSAELRVLPNRREALENLANRTDVAGLRSVVGALNQAQRYGTPIAQALRTTANDLRATNLLAMEEWAARIPAKMTMPIVLFILPSVFLIIAGPSFIQIMRTM